MRTTRLLLAAIALPVSLHAQDSTQTPRPRDSTLLEKLGLRGVQVSFGGGAAPYRGRATGTAGTAEFRLGFTPRSHSEWTIAVTNSMVTDPDTAGYVAPGSTTFHPRMMEAASGIELQRRWSGSTLLHPMAQVGAGQMSNAYKYYSYPSTGGRTLRSDDSNAAAYVTAGGGAELNVSSWMRISLTASYRKAGETAISFGRGSSSGVSSAMLLEFGRF